MEVHHHPEVEKKGFKEYLLEGLMIFVAVMMGFIAENVREGITEREHVKQLTSQMINDLRSDTSLLNQVYNAEKEIIKRNDTLFNLLQQPLDRADKKNIQRLIVGSYSLWPFYPATGAATAIQNELHLKPFTNSKMIGYIAQYRGRAAILKKIEDLESAAQDKYLESFCKLHFTPANMIAAFDRTAIVDGNMRDITPKGLTELSVEVVLIRSYNKELILYNRKLKDDAIKMMSYVKKQFDLDE